MAKNKKFVGLFIAFAFSLTALLFYGVYSDEISLHDQDQGNEKLESGKEFPERFASLTKQPKHSENASNSYDVNDSLSEVTKGYDLLKSKFSGKSLRDEQIEYIGRVTIGLSPMEICLFLDYVSDELGDDMERLAHLIGAAMSTADSELGNSEEIQKWVISVKSPIFKTALLREMGRYYSGVAGSDPMPFYQKISLESEKDRFLAGFIEKFTGDVRSPIEWLIKFSPESGEHPQLIKVIKNLPESYDISKISQYSSENVNSLSDDVKGALIGKWVDTDPVAAANFLAGSKISDAEQILGSMMSSSSEKLLPLMSAWENTPQKDDAISHLLQNFTIHSPQLAWELGLQMSNAENRELLLTEVYYEWAEKNKEDADAAWNKFFGE
ncbi:hypothetical protein JIN85_17815 [Luteolibacter pohnpeiensis]|uniref:Uncharacterized protein n=1 Tax=Luteolibacter pohnpeiensis TaxID=454153 RepID=A0A934SB61_9BACT|nr:hypothetical protein [Luteolibacter pohnpeiensis]MBK1884281.1 hypothetical protein [Luteolibacter pohnpeiensis]